MATAAAAPVVETEAMKGWVAAMEARAPRAAAATAAAAAATASVAVAATASAQQVGHNSRDRVCTAVRVIWYYRAGIVIDVPSITVHVADPHGKQGSSSLAQSGSVASD